RPDLVEALSSTPAVAGLTRDHRNLHRALISVEVGLTFVLLMSAALLAGSFVRMLRVDVGFNPYGLAMVRLVLPDRYRAGPAQDQFVERIVERLRSLPTVRAVATGTGV